MTINLHNYEEYFLLYADNELSKWEKIEVEQFIKENPALEEEFDMIIDTVNEPDETLQLSDKSFLLKSVGTDFVTEENYDQVFVLFHHGELTEDERYKTNQFLKTHLELEEEFLLIGQAKLEGEMVSYPDKKLLLRKEHSGITRRIILFLSLAAAVVLGLGLWITIPYFNGDSIQPQIAQNPNIPESDSHNLQLTEKSTGKSEITEDAFVEQKVPAAEGLSESTTQETNGIEEKSPKVFRGSEKQILAKKVIEQSTELKSKSAMERIVETKKDEGNTRELIAQIPQKKISTGDLMYSNTAAHIDLDITLQAIENNNSQNVVYLDVNKESSENYIFYNVPADEFRKTKIGGFLKKLKRVAERNDPIKRLFEMEADQVVSSN